MEHIALEKNLAHFLCNISWRPKLHPRDPSAQTARCLLRPASGQNQLAESICNPPDDRPHVQVQRPVASKLLRRSWPSNAIGRVVNCRKLPIGDASTNFFGCNDPARHHGGTQQGQSGQDAGVATMRHVHASGD